MPPSGRAQTLSIMLSQTDLAHFTGTSQYYKHGIGPLTIYLTDGCKHVAEEGKAYWLFDLILSYQMYRAVRQQFVQVWKLQKQQNDGWLATCEDGNGTVLQRQEIPYSDFALDSITILVKDNICLLPSED